MLIAPCSVRVGASSRSATYTYLLNFILITLLTVGLFTSMPPWGRS